MHVGRRDERRRRARQAVRRLEKLGRARVVARVALGAPLAKERRRPLGHLRVCGGALATTAAAIGGGRVAGSGGGGGGGGGGGRGGGGGGGGGGVGVLGVRDASQLGAPRRELEREARQVDHPVLAVERDDVAARRQPAVLERDRKVLDGLPRPPGADDRDPRGRRAGADGDDARPGGARQLHAHHRRQREVRRVPHELPAALQRAAPPLAAPRRRRRRRGAAAAPLLPTTTTPRAAAAATAAAAPAAAPAAVVAHLDLAVAQQRVLHLQRRRDQQLARLEQPQLFPAARAAHLAAHRRRRDTTTGAVARRPFVLVVARMRAPVDRCLRRRCRRRRRRHGRRAATTAVLGETRGSAIDGGARSSRGGGRR